MDNLSRVPNLMQQVQSIVPNFCEKCGAKHMKTDLEVVERSLDKMVCKLSCTSCQNTYIIHLTASPEGLLTQRKSFKSDLTQEEYKKFSNFQDIEKEEILDVFVAINSLESIDDLKNLLAE